MLDTSRTAVFVSVGPYDASRNRKCTFEINERRQEVARLASQMWDKQIRGFRWMKQRKNGRKWEESAGFGSNFQQLLPGFTVVTETKC